MMSDGYGCVHFIFGLVPEQAARGHLHVGHFGRCMRGRAEQRQAKQEEPHCLRLNPRFLFYHKFALRG